jgi:hypothetical protein
LEKRVSVIRLPQVRAQAIAEDTFVRVLAAPHQDSAQLRAAFARAAHQLLETLRRQGERADTIDRVRDRCDDLDRSIPRSSKFSD